jgi:hypothetical protein
MTVRVDQRGHARLVTVSRPEKKNALDLRTADALREAIDDAAGDDEVRGIVLMGEGNVFLSGGDLGEIARALEEADGAERVLEMGRLLGAIERAPVPVVAAVTGDVYGGGCELVLLCDFVIVEASAGFSFRHARMGLSPAWGGARSVSPPAPCPMVRPPRMRSTSWSASRARSEPSSPSRSSSSRGCGPRRAAARPRSRRRRSERCGRNRRIERR